MPKKRRKKHRPTTYRLSGYDVVMAGLASEAIERHEREYLGKLHEERSLPPSELKKYITEELETTRSALRGTPDDREKPVTVQRAMQIARLLVYERDPQYRQIVNRTGEDQRAPEPDPRAAVKSVEYLLRRIEQMESGDWWKKLKALLET